MHLLIVLEKEIAHKRNSREEKAMWFWFVSAIAPCYFLLTKSSLGLPPKM